MAKNKDFEADDDFDTARFEIMQRLVRDGKKSSQWRQMSWGSLRDPERSPSHFDMTVSKFLSFESELQSKPIESDLDKYPKPSLAVDVAILSVIPVGNTHRLIALATQRGVGHESGSWSLPGRMVRERETLEQTALDALRLKLGITGVEVEQLRVFDDPDRDPRGWVISVAHIATISSDIAFDALAKSDVAPILIDEDGITLPDNQVDLPFEQMHILREAVKELRRRYSLLPDPGRILDDEFTLTQLREVHEAIQDVEIAPDTFRREMLPNLTATGHRVEGSVGKPPMMYRRKELFESKVRTSRMLSARMIEADEFL